MRVVGLIEEPNKEGAQGAFVQEAFARWRALTAPLPEDSPGRFPDGWYRMDYALEGELKEIELHRFENILEKAVVRHTGWPMFLFLTRHELQPREVDGVIECWLKPEDAGVERPFGDAAHCDFWRVAPTGRAFIIRGYQEDGQDTLTGLVSLHSSYAHGQSPAPKPAAPESTASPRDSGIAGVVRRAVQTGEGFGNVVWHEGYRSRRGGQ